MTGQAEYRDAAPPGSQVGQLRLDRAIGQGGEGIVYEAHHALYGAVLVKEFWPKLLVSRAKSQRAQPSQASWQLDYRRGVERFQDLGERLRALPLNSGVMRVHEVISDRNTAYLVMEKVAGKTLARSLEGGAFDDPDQVRLLADKLITTLSFIHDHGLLHRDIAPDNIMVTPGYEWEAVLIDFNAAKDMVLRASRSSEGIVKPGYTPIEQYDTDGAESVGPWTDIYAASAVLYRVITGAPPVDPSKRLLRPALHAPLAGRDALPYPPEFLAAIDTGLSAHPDNRPQDVANWRDRFGETLPSQAEAVREARIAAAAEEAQIAAQTRAALLAAEKAKRNAETKRATDAARAKHEREASEARAAEAKKAAAALRDAEVARIAAEAEEAEAARRRDEEAAIPESDHSAQEPSSDMGGDAEEENEQLAWYRRPQTIVVAAVGAGLAALLTIPALSPTPTPPRNTNPTEAVSIKNDVIDNAANAVEAVTVNRRDALQTSTKLCREICSGGEVVEGYESRTVVGRYHSAGETTYSLSANNAALRAREKAAGYCKSRTTKSGDSDGIGNMPYGDVQYSDAECPAGDLCIIRVHVACYETKQIQVRVDSPKQCKTVC